MYLHNIVTIVEKYEIPHSLIMNLDQNPLKYKPAKKKKIEEIKIVLLYHPQTFKNTSSYETGLSDHHHLIYSVMKTIFKCEEPKKLIYRNYSNFSQKDFQNELLLNIGDGKNNYLEFEKNFVETLNKHTPKKTKLLRGNHKSHIIKTLRKVIMKRSQLKNKANKTNDPKGILKYKK